jgi:hypothetical protein
VKTVLDVYGHLYDEADVALRERLEAMFVPVIAVRRTHAIPASMRSPQKQSNRQSKPGLTSENRE